MKYAHFFLGIGVLILLLAWYLAANEAMAPEEIELEEIPPASTSTETDIQETPTDTPDTPDPTDWPFEAKPGLIRVDSVAPNGTIASPLTISGEARGYWFFEASFPIVLTNWDGLIIAEGVATADGEWMTEDFVPFTTTLEFTSPYQSGDPDFMQRGYLILHKDNPSGLPENDDALEIPIKYAPAS